MVRQSRAGRRRSTPRQGGSRFLKGPKAYRYRSRFGFSGLYQPSQILTPFVRAIGRAQASGGAIWTPPEPQMAGKRRPCPSWAFVRPLCLTEMASPPVPRDHCLGPVSIHLVPPPIRFAWLPRLAGGSRTGKILSALNSLLNNPVKLG